MRNTFHLQAGIWNLEEKWFKNSNLSCRLLFIGAEFFPGLASTFPHQFEINWSSVRIYCVEGWSLYNSPCYRFLSVVQLLQLLKFQNRAVQKGLEPAGAKSCARAGASATRRPLGPKEASTTACSLALHRHSPGSELGRKRLHRLAAATRRQPPRPNRHRALPPGEPNHTLVPLVHLLRPPFTAGELPPPPEGIFVNTEGTSVKPGTWL
jgi:hypothetical protein